MTIAKHFLVDSIKSLLEHAEKIDYLQVATFESFQIWKKKIPKRKTNTLRANVPLNFVIFNI